MEWLLRCHRFVCSSPMLYTVFILKHFPFKAEPNAELCKFLRIQSLMTGSWRLVRSRCKSVVINFARSQFDCSDPLLCLLLGEFTMYYYLCYMALRLVRVRPEHQPPFLTNKLVCQKQLCLMQNIYRVLFRHNEQLKSIHLFHCMVWHK